MLVLKVVIIAVGVNFVATGIHQIFWGMRFLARHPVPERMRPIPGVTRITPRAARRIVIGGWVRTTIWAVLVLNGLILVFLDDTMSIGSHQLRLFSSSSNVVLDFGKGLAVTLITIFVHQNSRIIMGSRRPERPPLSKWKPRHRPSRRTGIMLVWWGSAVCALVIAVAVLMTVPFFTGSQRGVFLLLTPSVVYLSGPLYLVGLDLRRRGRRHLARIIMSPAELDNESFVLYLRNFADDDDLDRAESRQGIPVLTHLLLSGRGEEEQIGRVVSPVGKLVAVGEPGEQLPYVGAERLYLPANNWHTTMRALIQRAQLVVLVLGDGEGTMWELVECVRLLPPDRLVLLVPMLWDEYDEFRRDADKHLAALSNPPALPLFDHDPRVMELMPSRLKGAIYYDDEWRPTFVWLQRELGYIRRFPMFRDKLYVALKYALNPVVDRLTKAGD